MSTPTAAERVACLLHGLSLEELALLALVEVCRNAGCSEEEFQMLKAVIFEKGASEAA